MIPVPNFAGKTVALFGLGSSGLASARALEAGGARAVVYDDDTMKHLQAAANGFDVKNLREADWSTFTALVLAPGVPLTHPAPHWTVQKAQAAGVEVIGDIELFCRARVASGMNCPLVAITGTNGKSTTTALTAHLLRAAGRDVQMGGNIGVAMLSLEPFAPGRCYVAEVSSYQIDLAPNLRATAGIMLNVSEDHLDRHGTIENYAAVKALLPAKVEAGGVAIIGVDDAFGRDMADRIERAGKTVMRVSVTRALRDGLYAEGSRIMRAENGKAFPIAQLAGIGSLRGVHNAQNAACAIAAAQALGLQLRDIQQGLMSFPGLAHRMEQIGRKGPVLFVNDSKATNADSAARALASYQDIFWILGGKPKTGGIASLAEFFPRVRKAYLIGEAAEDFARTLEGKVPYDLAGKLDRAVELAARDAEASGLRDPVVLLSPACASFDQYRNFEIRGDHFRKLVEAIPGIALLPR